MNELNLSQDFIVSELLSELKSENTRKSKLIKSLIILISVCLISIIIVVGFFIWYLNQYDFTSTETVTTTATGVYALVDNEGNIIARDLSMEDIESIMEVLNGEGESN